MIREPLTANERRLLMAIAGEIAASKSPNIDVQFPEAYTDARARAAAEMRAKGHTFRRIGATLGVDATTIRRWLDPAVDQKYRDACLRRAARIRPAKEGA
jgi:hypothetical protein